MAIKMLSLIKNTKLLESTAYTKRQRNINYLMELKSANLLLPFYMEAGLEGSLCYMLTDIHYGWESPTSQIRGTFTGHWLSAAAHIISETKHMELKAKADFIVSEIARCQEANGGQWAFSIPEKYLYGLKKGRHFWAPQYVCHKTMMGLLDMYKYADNKQALEIVLKCAEWFYHFTNDITRENMNDMMDLEETGGMMELWADLYSVTKNSRHLELMRRYERPRLFEPIYNGKDVLTNMHANTTIPEIHGAARAYEVTGEERYRKIVENFWDLAVTKRGTYATGGQTCGEIWTPMGRQSARLGERNQEHCTVYNMIRLADYLLRWTGKSEYSDYIERNIVNGLFAQGYWEEKPLDTLCDPNTLDTGLVAYYLPLAAGSKKRWGSKTKTFWCCHGTLVQANARYREFIYYKDQDGILVSQYMPSMLMTQIKNIDVTIEQRYADLSGHNIKIMDISTKITERPDYIQSEFNIQAQNPIKFTLKFRSPWWMKSELECYVNGEKFNYVMIDGFACVDREWYNDKVTIILRRGLTCWPLADEKDTVAFLDGPVVLAGLVGEERILYGDINDPSTILKIHNEREWGNWLNTYKTVNQPVSFYFKPLKDIGKEIYTVYFPVRKVNKFNNES